MIKEDLASIILQVTLSVTFIVIFFFTYGSYLESKVVRDQVDYVVTDLMTDIKIMDGSSLNLLTDIANNIKAPNMEEQDAEAMQHNNTIMYNALIIFGILFIIGISISSFMMIYYNLDYKTIILRALLSVSAVAIIYFLYTTFVLGNYHSADTNVVKKAIIDSLIDFEKK